MSKIFKITEMLLQRYNEPSIEDNINISSDDHYDFKKLILKLRETYSKPTFLDENNIQEINCDELYAENPNPPTEITKANFVLDLVLAEKIVIFRKLEIKKQVTILYYYIQSFKVTAYQLLKYEEKNAAKLTDPIIANKYRTLQKNKAYIEGILRKILEDVDEINNFFRKTICRYATLEENLELLLKKYTP